MKHIITLFTALLFAFPAFADKLLPYSETGGQVVVYVEPNNAWGYPMPEKCPVKFNYTTNTVSYDRFLCILPWLENLATLKAVLAGPQPK